MVSIPDWARFSRMLEGKQHKSNTPSSRYLRQREEDVVRQAEESGYFLDATKTFIEQKFAPQEKETEQESLLKALLGEEKKPPDILAIQMIKLTHSHLRSVGDIGICRNLTICDLSNNFVTHFDSLAACMYLVKLDLHSNQITTVPNMSFWINMEFLKILLLHDNPIGKIENIHNLASAGNLTALTLYDTPLSLKRNFRHHVVNSIWSLRALDHHVISDEEIIEDATFGGRFAALHPSFSIELCPPMPEGSTFQDEFKSIQNTLREVNRIQAHNSPVLLIQRHVRGYLIRRQFRFVADTRIWAAVTIQRKYRDWKDLPAPLNAGPLPPPPTSPGLGGRPQHPPGTVDSIKMDYDTYMRNRRPGSTGASEASTYSKQQAKEAKAQGGAPVSPASSATIDGRKKKNIFINLTKLQAGTLQSLQDETIAMETVFPSEGYGQNDSSKKIDSSRKFKRKKEPEKKKKVIKSVKQFFGPVVESVPTPVPERAPSASDGEEVPIINFRLRGSKKMIDMVDPTTDLIMARREAGHEVRVAEAEYHRQSDNIPKPFVEKRPMVNKSKQLFAKVQGTMGLSCLRAVQQAYKDREVAEKQAAHLESVINMRDRREAGQHRIKLYREDRRSNILQEREREHKRLLDVMEKKELQQLGYLDQSQEKKNRRVQLSRQRRGELTFVSDFNVQNTSVSNALLRHDRQAKGEDKLREKTEIVQSYKATETEQQDIVKKYMEHRQLMRQTESAMSRAQLDTKMLQEANDRILEARSRVAQQKSRSAKAEATVILPSIIPAAQGMAMTPHQHHHPVAGAQGDQMPPSSAAINPEQRQMTAVM